MADWVLLKHDQTGAVHRFPARTQAAWQARGWQPYTPPPEKPAVLGGAAGAIEGKVRRPAGPSKEL